MDFVMSKNFKRLGKIPAKMDFIPKKSDPHDDCNNNPNWLEHGHKDRPLFVQNPCVNSTSKSNHKNSLEDHEQHTKLERKSMTVVENKQLAPAAHRVPNSYQLHIKL